MYALLHNFIVSSTINTKSKLIHNPVFVLISHLWEEGNVVLKQYVYNYIVNKTEQIGSFHFCFVRLSVGFQCVVSKLFLTCKLADSCLTDVVEELLFTVLPGNGFGLP